MTVVRVCCVCVLVMRDGHAGDDAALRILDRAGDRAPVELRVADERREQHAGEHGRTAHVTAHFLRLPPSIPSLELVQSLKRLPSER